MKPIQLPNGFWIPGHKDHECTDHEVERDVDAICLDCREHCGVVECTECEDSMSNCCGSGVWCP